MVPHCEIDKYDPPNFRLMPNLRQLAFSCTSKTNLIEDQKIMFLLHMKFDYLTREPGLNTLTKLKELQLRIEYINIDRFFLDGYESERFLSNSTSDLSTFDFSFSRTIDRSWPTFWTRFWLEEKQWLCDVFPVNEGLLSTSVEHIFSHLFPAIEHISLRIDDSHSCNQFNRYSFPCKTLSTLRINYLYHSYTQAERLNEFDRNFILTDHDEKPNIWFGEIVNDENIQIDNEVKEEKKIVKDFRRKKYLFS
jgi:hypothetical protein